MQLHWSGATRYHDWYDKHRTIPHEVLLLVQDTGLLGKIDWIAGSDDEKKEVDDQGNVMENLLAHRPKRGQLYRIAAGGADPLPWHMTLGLFPFQKSMKQVRGYNIINFWFESEPFSGGEGSDALVKAFRTIHTPDNTEFAFIHPYERYSELSDMTKAGPYENPVTLGPMFRGVYWANFLGQEHLEFFDKSRLKDIQTYKVDWMGDDGLFIQVSPDISDATSPATEKEMFRLTEIFRKAFR